MLKAYDKNKKIKISYKDIINKNEEYTCPECLDYLTFVNARFKIKHFRHKVASNCDPEPETQEHIEMKMFMQNKLNLADDCIEVPLGFGKPDLLMKNSTQQTFSSYVQSNPNIAIEVQHSKLSYDIFIKRTENYTKNNYYVIWIFHEKLLKELIPEFLKKAHEIYFGRIYVYKNKNIYPVHAEATQSYVNEYDDYESGESYGGYYKYNKKKKKYVFGNKIVDFSFLTSRNTWKGNDYKVAMFKDKKFWGNNNGGN